jgi:4'-phosphopantetheinyl transferase
LSLLLIWGEPAAAAAYCAERLTAEQRAQAERRRASRARTEWAVSRALMQSAEIREGGAPGRGWSLSHSDRHALLLRARPGQACGVDLECRRPRPVARLAEWIASPEEQEWLLTLDEPEQLKAFYRLWTLKEALVKAMGLAFPGGMRQSTLTFGHHDAPRLAVTAAGTWQARVFEWDTWTAAVVWEGAGAAELSWAAGPNSTLPAMVCTIRASTSPPDSAAVTLSDRR